jgi:hypothetical protein
LRTRQTQLLGRVEELTNDEADAVCLDLELIPREQILDRRLKPKAILLRYTSQVNSPAQLDSIGRAINNVRR